MPFFDSGSVKLGGFCQVGFNPDGLGAFCLSETGICVASEGMISSRLSEMYHSLQVGFVSVLAEQPLQPLDPEPKYLPLREFLMSVVSLTCGTKDCLREGVLGCGSDLVFLQECYCAWRSNQ